MIGDNASLASAVVPALSGAAAGASLRREGRTMKLTIERVEANGERREIGSTTSERRARQIARAQAQIGAGQVYITWYRASDGQHGYLNRDGHSPIGKAW